MQAKMDAPQTENQGYANSIYNFYSTKSKTLILYPDNDLQSRLAMICGTALLFSPLSLYLGSLIVGEVLFAASYPVATGIAKGVDYYYGT